MALGGQASVSCRHHHLLVSVPSSLLHLPHSKASRLPHHSFERSRAFPHFCSPSEGAQFSRVFCSPSEGAQSHGALCSACTRVFVSCRLIPPSEGGPNPAVSVSPLEGEHVYLFRNGSRFRISLPLWKGTGEAMPSRKPIARMRRKSHSATAGKCRKCCRCGRGLGRQCRPGSP